MKRWRAIAVSLLATMAVLPIGPAGASERVDTILRHSPKVERTSADMLTWRIAFTAPMRHLHPSGNLDPSDFDVAGTTAKLTLDPVAVDDEGCARVWDATLSGGDLATLNGRVSIIPSAARYVYDCKGWGERMEHTSPLVQRTNRNWFIVENTGTAPAAGPVMTVRADNARVDEGQDAVFTVSADKALVQPLTVHFVVSETPGSDVLAAGNEGAGTLFLAAGAHSATYRVPTVDDDADDGHAGTVGIALRPGDGYRVGLPASAATDVIDDDPAPRRTDGVPSVVFATGASRVEEGEGRRSITLNIWPTPSAPFTLRYGVSGQARQGADYTIAGLTGNTGTLTVPAGAFSATLELSVRDDGAPEDDERAVLSLEDGAGYRLGIRSVHYVTIADNDEPAGTPGVTVSTGTLNLTEGGAAGSYTVKLQARPTANVTVTATSGDAGAVKVHKSGGTPGASAPLTFTPTTWNQTQTVTVTPQSDGDADDENVTIAHSVSNTGGYAGVTANPVTVTVDDDDTTTPSACVSAPLRADVERYAGETHHGPAHVDRWKKVLAAFGDTNGYTAMTASEARQMRDQFSASRWNPVVTALRCLEGTTNNDDPLVTVTGGSAITEGGNALFIVSANPAPSANLTVTLTVDDDATSDFLRTSHQGRQSAVIQANQGSATLTLPTVNDSTDEPSGSVRATVASGTGYRIGAPSTATVAVSDDDITAPSACVSAPLRADVERYAGETRHGQAHVDRWKKVLAAFGDTNGYTAMTASEARQMRDQFSASRWNPVVTALHCLEGTTNTDPLVTITGGGAITEGGDALFTVSANPAPSANLTVTLTVADDATSDFLGTSHQGRQSVVIQADQGSATLTLPTVNDSTDEPDGSVRATVASGTGYRIGTPSTATVAVSDDDAPPPRTPVVRIAAGGAITEGGTAIFTLTATPAPRSAISVKVRVTQAGDFARSDQTGTKNVTVGTNGTGTLTVATVNDNVNEHDGRLDARVLAGTGYTPSDTAGAATVHVADDDVPAGAPSLSVDDVTVREGPDRPVRVSVRLSKASDRTVYFYYQVRESSPVSAKEDVDYFAATRKGLGHVRSGETRGEFVAAWVVDDSHDEGDETFELVISDAQNATIAKAVGVATIANDDPMPKAWLARFGRTAAERALDGIAGRMAAPRTPGARGTLAGQALAFGEGGSAGTANDTAATGGLFDHRGLGLAAERFGAGGPGHGDTGLRPPAAPSRTLTLGETLRGSRFTATGETDATGGSLAFWGRAAEARFDGREGAFSLDGEATTAMLGTDYARGDWLVGLALMQSEGEGDYRDTDVAPRPTSQTCPEDVDEARCAGAVREGGGEVDASLTAVLPYASLQASERLALWGALGIGAGEVTLETGMGQRLDADIDWTMAAAGARSALLPVPAQDSGPALALTSDALWARTSSDATHELAASDSDVTRLRLGLEGSYRFATAGDGHLTPRVEVGARHDGGDAETGFGVELGAGLAWSDPALGLSLDLSGRTLIAHDAGDLEDRGFAASLGFDPEPASARGPSLSLRQALGGRATGGLDVLFRAEGLRERTGSDTTRRRWQAEAAYGLPAFGGRFTASPHLGLSLGTGTRDYSLGWRLTPAANANAPDLSFGVKTTRREGEGTAPEHGLGVELRTRW